MRAYERLLEYVKVKTPSSEENMETPSVRRVMKRVRQFRLLCVSLIWRGSWKKK